MIRNIRILGVLFFSISLVNARFIEKSLSITVIQESVNGIRFAHRSDLIDGKIQDVWAINGRSVSHDEYLDSILDAEREERRTQRQLENEKRKQEQEFKALAQSNGLKKLIKIKINEIMRELTKVKEPLLESYLQFDEATVASPEDLSAVASLISDAQKKCREDQELPCSSLKECLASLEGLPEKLTKLYQDSITYAIKTCDDTRSLKDLLSLVSQVILKENDNS